MAVFPETVIPDFPLEIKSELRVIKTQLDTGVEYRRRKWRFPIRQVTLNFPHLTPDERETLLNFIVSVGNSYQSFYWFDYLTRQWFDEFVGRGDGTVTTFTLPGKEIDEATLKIYVDGALKTAGTDYTFSAGSGPNGEDQITFSAAPANGALITADFKGKLRLKCRLLEDAYSLTHRIANYYSLNITLVEVRS